MSLLRDFGAGWLQDQLRSRFDLRGPIGVPNDLEDKARVVMEARPSLPWEYGNARWLPVCMGTTIAAGGAGTYASVSFSVVTTAQRALMVTRLVVSNNAGATLGVYLDTAFVNPNVGAGVTDSRFKAGTSSFNPVLDCGCIAQNAAVALPAAATRVAVIHEVAGRATEFVLEGMVLMPGNTFSAFTEQANTPIAAWATGYLVPLADLS